MFLRFGIELFTVKIIGKTWMNFNEHAICIIFQAKKLQVWLFSLLLSDITASKADFGCPLLSNKRG